MRLMILHNLMQNQTYIASTLTLTLYVLGVDILGYEILNNVGPVRLDGQSKEVSLFVAAEISLC